MRHKKSSIVVLLAAAFYGCHPNSRSEVLGQATPRIQDDPSHLDCKRLDVGLFWYGKGNRAVKATANDHTFYDPTKPTLIYIHGWAFEAHRTLKRETFFQEAPSSSLMGETFGRGVPKELTNTTAATSFGTVEEPKATAASALTDGDNDSLSNAADAWIDAGWNMGLFEWSQFADDLLQDVELKIWQGQQPLTWRDCAGNAIESALYGTMTDVAVAEIVANMSDFKGPELRLVGHSLGAQLAASTAHELAKKAAASEEFRSLMPQRVAQLDPYWTAWGGARAAAAVDTIVQETAAEYGMAWEVYRTSAIADLWLGAQNPGLGRLVGQMEFHPNLWGWHPWPMLRAAHVWARRLYFSSLTDHYPSDCEWVACQSAASSLEETRDFMSMRSSFSQNTGQMTETTSDDRFSWAVKQAGPTQ